MNNKYDRDIAKTVRHIRTKLNNTRPIFVDTPERVENEYEIMENFRTSSNIDLSNFHMPFPKLTFILPKVILSITKIADKYMEFVLDTTVEKVIISGKIEIHRTQEKPMTQPSIQKHRHIRTDLSTGWSILTTVEVIHRIGDNFYYGSTMDDKWAKNIMELFIYTIAYFYPFCVNKEMFVVESQPAMKKKGKIRTKGRSTFSIMHVKKVMKRFTPTGQPGKPLHKGHPRRAHLREYRSSRWTNMQGNSIIVQSTWVGPKEILSEGRLYKVHTDIY
jgi:hypothetical protein